MSAVGLNYRTTLVPEGCDAYNLIQASKVSTLFEPNEKVGKIVTNDRSFKVTIRPNNVAIDLNQDEWKDLCNMVASIMINKNLLVNPTFEKMTINGVGFVKKDGIIAKHQEGTDTSESFKKIVAYILAKRKPENEENGKGTGSATGSGNSSPKSANESSSSPEASPPPSPDLNSKKAPNVKVNVQVDDQDLASSSAEETEVESESESESEPSEPKAKTSKGTQKGSIPAFRYEDPIPNLASGKARRPIERTSWFKTIKSSSNHDRQSKASLAGRLGKEKLDRFNEIRRKKLRNATIYQKQRTVNFSLPNTDQSTANSDKAATTN